MLSIGPGKCPGSTHGMQAGSLVPSGDTGSLTMSRCADALQAGSLVPNGMLDAQDRQGQSLRQVLESEQLAAGKGNQQAEEIASSLVLPPPYMQEYVEVHIEQVVLVGAPPGVCAWGRHPWHWHVCWRLGSSVQGALQLMSCSGQGFSSAGWAGAQKEGPGSCSLPLAPLFTFCTRNLCLGEPG